jgi:hypothetical protein
VAEKEKYTDVLRQKEREGERERERERESTRAGGELRGRKRCRGPNIYNTDIIATAFAAAVALRYNILSAIWLDLFSGIHSYVRLSFLSVIYNVVTHD